MKYRVTLTVSASFHDYAEDLSTAESRLVRALAAAIENAVIHGEWEGYDRDTRVHVHVDNVAGAVAQKLTP